MCNACIFTNSPVGTQGDVRLEDGTLGFLLEKVNEVRLDAVIVGARGIVDCGQEAGGLGVAFGDLVRVKGSQGVVLEAEEPAHSVVAKGGCRATDGANGAERDEEGLGHHGQVGAVLVRDLPLPVLSHVDKGTMPPDFVFGDGRGDVDSLRHHGGVMVADLPLVVLEHVDVGVPGLHHIARGAHGELGAFNVRMEGATEEGGGCGIGFAQIG